MAAPESLTSEERGHLDVLAGDLREIFAREVAKLLRIHDAHMACIENLEAERQETEQALDHQRNQHDAQKARVQELEAELSAAQALEHEWNR